MQEFIFHTHYFIIKNSPLGDWGKYDLISNQLEQCMDAGFLSHSFFIDTGGTA